MAWSDRLRTIGRWGGEPAPVGIALLLLLGPLPALATLWLYPDVDAPWAALLVSLALYAVTVLGAWTFLRRRGAVRMEAVGTLGLVVLVAGAAGMLASLGAAWTAAECALGQCSDGKAATGISSQVLGPVSLLAIGAGAGLLYASVREPLVEGPAARARFLGRVALVLFVAVLLAQVLHSLLSLMEEFAATLSEAQWTPAVDVFAVAPALAVSLFLTLAVYPLGAYLLTWGRLRDETGQERPAKIAAHALAALLMAGYQAMQLFLGQDAQDPAAAALARAGLATLPFYLFFLVHALALGVARRPRASSSRSADAERLYALGRISRQEYDDYRTATSAPPDPAGAFRVALAALWAVFAALSLPALLMVGPGAGGLAAVLCGYAAAAVLAAFTFRAGQASLRSRRDAEADAERRYQALLDRANAGPSRPASRGASRARR